MVERDEKHVLRAVPEGSAPVTMDDDWLEDIRQHRKLVWHRADFRRNVLAVATLFLLAYDYTSYTSTPGNDYLRREAGIGAGTLARVKRWLIRQGFLGLVAGGRQARYTPRISDGHSNLFKRGDRPDQMADRAVFVLCRPLSERELAQYGEREVQRMDFRCKLDPFLSSFSAAVDISGNPIPSTAKSNPKSIREWASPTLKSYFKAAARVTAMLDAARTDLQWPTNRTTNAPDQATRDFNELQGARTVQWHSPPLKKLPSRYVTRMLAPFFRADYSPKDILHAIDNKPDGSPHQRDGFDGALNVAALLQSRLNHWRCNGQPIYSRTQREAMRAKEPVSRARAATAKAETVSLPSPAANPAHAQGIAKLRALWN
ncbi:hypothetical protein PSET11_03311 [Arthrobacter ulcerisalmonis]|uniref:Uncharacterized protein n=3 Tax=Arthrobacter ulcerisalmonis TaxID=2483813 RepID=A0A3P5XF03_9MICC|nr:hypothetical protein PSET11_03311 [Arthrobacter ulcerisalmonis]